MPEVEAIHRAEAPPRALGEEKRGAPSPPHAPPSRVTLPDAARRRAENFPPPLKVENEEPDGTSSQNMWQVYALGGFLILRWIWARWKERQNKAKSNEDSSS